MNVGLVLSGGMAKGAYQVGSLKAISNFLPINEIKYISCASIGALNGYAFAANKLERAEQMWKGICKDQKNNRAFITRILKSPLLQQNIEQLCDEPGGISSRFYTSLLDIQKRNLVYKDLASVDLLKHEKYLKASVALPIYNRAVSVDGTSFFDGAMVDNIPVYPLLKHKLDYIICIYFDDSCYKFESANIDNKIIKVTFPCKSRVRQSLEFCQNGIEKMIDDGYHRTTEILGRVLRNGYDDVEYIYDKIEQIDREEDRKLRITGDVIITNLNKVTQRFAQKTIIE